MKRTSWGGNGGIDWTGVFVKALTVLSKSRKFLIVGHHEGGCNRVNCSIFVGTRISSNCRFVARKFIPKSSCRTNILGAPYVSRIRYPYQISLSELDELSLSSGKPPTFPSSPSSSLSSSSPSPSSSSSSSESRS